MNKKFIEFFSYYGMEFNGKVAYGKIQGYETNATLASTDNVAPLKMHVSFYATDEQKQNIQAQIRALALKFVVMQFTPYGLALGFNDITLNKLLKRLPETLEAIYKILSENGAKKSEFCPVCGNPLASDSSKKCNIDGYTITIDNECVNTINNIINAENQDFNAAPNNYFKGFIGALLGGLVGVAITVILYMIGFVSALSAVVSIVLGAFLYQKFQGKPNKMMVVIVTLTTLVLQAITIPAIYITAAGIAANEVGLGISTLEAFQMAMQDAELARYFYSELAMVVLFTAIGAGIEIFALSKKIKRTKNI